jgi:hypothetical protein
MGVQVYPADEAGAAQFRESNGGPNRYLESSRFRQRRKRCVVSLR